MGKKKEFIDGMYDSNRCGFCHDFGKKVKPFICVNCWEKIDTLLQEELKQKIMEESPKDNPCLCVICKCGNIIMATAILKVLMDDDFCADFRQRAKDGYMIRCFDAKDFVLNKCKCHPLKKRGGCNVFYEYED